MTSKNFNRVLTVVVNKLNKCYFNFTKPENMKSVTIEKSVFLVEHEVGLEIDDCDKFLYITVDGVRMYEINLDNEVKDSNELFNRVQYLLALVYGDVYNGNFDELVETDETDETEETEETEEVEEATTTRDRINYLMETHSFTLSKRYSYRDVEKVCGDCSHFNACMQGNQTIAPTCCMFDSLYKARKNPEWHHVSLNTHANIDFDMLDEKRQIYFTVYRDLQETLSHLRKCKTVNTYSACYNRFVKRLNVMWGKSKITNAMYKYIEAKLSMQNVESGLWSSAWEAATGSHESRRYNKSRA